MVRVSKLVLFIAIVCFVGGSLGVQANETGDTLQIRVQSTGDSRVSPDMAYIWLGVHAEGETATEALTTSNTIVQELLKAVTPYSMQNLIKTSDFSLSRKEQWDQKTQQAIGLGFIARHVYEIPVFDLSYVPIVLDTAVEQGANVIQGIQYAVAESRQAKEDAYRSALEEAWWKARLLADPEQYPNLRIIRVDETYYSTPYFAAEGRAVLSDSPDMFMPGQLKVVVNLQVEFEASH